MEEITANESLSEETRESAKGALEVLATSQIAQVKQQAEQDAALRALESETQFLQAEATATIKKEMAEWLGRHRLLRYAETIASVAGLDAAPSDLQFLTEEDEEQVGSAMTHVEKNRLAMALQALREEGAAESVRE